MINNHTIYTVDFTYNDTAYNVSQVVARLSQGCHNYVTTLLKLCNNLVDAVSGVVISEIDCSMISHYWCAC